MSMSSQRARWLRRGTAVAAITAGLALGGTAVAGAATPSASTSGSSSTATGSQGAPHHRGRHHGHPAIGTVTAVTSSTLTVSDPKGHSHTLVLTSTTTYTKDGASATASDVTAGEYVVIQRVRPSTPPTPGQKPTGPVTASAVHIVASLPKGPHHGGPHSMSGQSSSTSGQNSSTSG